MLFRNIGFFLAGFWNCRQTTRMGSSPFGVASAAFDADQPWNGSDTRGTHFLRYGFYNEGLKFDGNDPSQAGISPSLFTAGQRVGEREWQPDALLAAVRHPSNPFRLVGNQTYELTEQDLRDVVLVRHPDEDKTVYDTVVWDVLSGLGLTPSAIPPPRTVAPAPGGPASAGGVEAPALSDPSQRIDELLCLADDWSLSLPLIARAVWFVEVRPWFRPTSTARGAAIAVLGLFRTAVANAARRAAAAAARPGSGDAR